MNNSTKFTNQGGKVVVRIEQMASQINIAVIDDGIGIEA
jgi:signal transduction histidine kinase